MSHPQVVSSSHSKEMRAEFMDFLRPGQLLETLLDSVPGTFYFVKDLESRFMGGSQSFAESLGEDSISPMVGKTDFDYSPDFLAEVFYADDQAVVRAGQGIFNKIELVPSADGSLDWLCTTKIPLYGMNGMVVGLAGVARIIRDSDALYAEHPEMRQIVAFVRTHYREKVSVADIAQAGAVSVSSQERLFKKTFGLTPIMYLRKTRLNAACKLLRDTKVSLAAIAQKCGFNDQTSMTRAFRMELKITPLKYRRKFTLVQRNRSYGNKSVVLRAQL